MQALSYPSGKLVLPSLMWPRTSLLAALRSLSQTPTRWDFAAANRFGYHVAWQISQLSHREELPCLCVACKNVLQLIFTTPCLQVFPAKSFITNELRQGADPSNHSSIAKLEKEDSIEDTPAGVAAR